MLIKHKMDELLHKLSLLTNTFNNTKSEYELENEKNFDNNNILMTEITKNNFPNKIIKNIHNKINIIVIRNSIIQAHNYSKKLYVQNYLPESTKKFMIINNYSSFNNLPNNIYHLGVIDSSNSFKIRKVYKNIKYLELRNSIQDSSGYKIIKVNPCINSVLDYIHNNCYKRSPNFNHNKTGRDNGEYCNTCEKFYKTGGSGSVLYHIDVNKKYKKLHSDLVISA